MTDNKLDKILPAILKVQSTAPKIEKGTVNPFFKSKYADLADIWGAIRKSMAENELVVIHTMSHIDQVDLMTTRIYHTSGQFIESICPVMPQKKDAQSYGSTMTYMRRYSLSSMLGIVADVDDDGNEAVKPAPPPVIKMVNQAELDLMLNAIDEAVDMGALQSAFINVNAAIKRLTTDQMNNLTKAKNTRKAKLLEGSKS